MADQPIENKLSRRSEPATVVPLRPAAERKAGGKRSVALVRRWFRDTFSREQLLSSLRSLVWVAPLTVLIWIYAEREQVHKESALFSIEVRSGAPLQVARLADARGPMVTATISGPKAKVGLAVESLQSGVPVQVFIGGGRQPGLHDVEVLPLIEHDPRISENGLSVIACEPKILRVEVDAIQEESVDVVLPADVKHLLNGPPVFDPPQVRVSAPSAAFPKARDALKAEAELQESMLTPGRHGPVSVRVKVPGLSGPDVTLRQSTVMATVDVKDADEKYVIVSMSVSMNITPENADPYKVTREPKFLNNVPVYGPPDKIAQLKLNQLTPIPQAIINITASEVAAKKGTQTPKYELPEGIYIREQDKQTVTFEVTPRDTTQ
jgi:hypothetical protein